MKARAAVALAATLAAAPAAAQTTWTLQGGAGGARLVGPTIAELRGPQAQVAGLPAGDYEVHFGVDALGKPRSLALTVGDGEHVALAVAAGGREEADELDWSAPGWQDVDGVLPGRVHALPDAGDYRIEARVEPRAGVARCALVARWRGPQQHYALVVDLAAAELRLERWLGPEPIVLGRAPAPAAGAGAGQGSAWRLALQLHGFRLQAFVDDAPAFEVLDGAIATGGFGWRGAPGDWRWLRRGPVAGPCASAALVQTAAAARLLAATVVTPGHYYVLELRLDRPHPLLPLDAAGLEPWLLQRPAAPQVLQADWRDSPGRGGTGEVGRDGVFGGTLRWPALPGLRRQIALVRALLVRADGGGITAATPAVTLWL